jgi:geranylgeranyl diphosphate synthase type II
MKTGALIRASALLGCLAAGASLDSPEAYAAKEYAENIGLAFQIIDDILDVESTEEELGKSCGSDSEHNKTTFMTYYDVESARNYAAELTAKAISEISDNENSSVLTDLAVYLLERKA